MAEQSKRVSTTSGHGGVLGTAVWYCFVFFFALPKNSPPFLLCKQQASLARFDLQNSGFANIPWFLSKGCSSTAEALGPPRHADTARKRRAPAWEGKARISG